MKRLYTLSTAILLAGCLIFCVASRSEVLSTGAITHDIGVDASAVVAQRVLTDGTLSLCYTEAASQAEPVCRVFNRSNGGFAVVAADGTLLAYGDSGRFDPENVPAGFKWWLSAVRASGSGSSLAPNTVSSQGHHPAVEPLLTTQWGQGRPYNAKAPTYDDKPCLVGDYATAVGQILYYHHSTLPVKSVPGYYTATHKIKVTAQPATSFNWSAMGTYYDPYDSNADEVARLLRYCGQAYTVDYTPYVSRATTSFSATPLINYFNCQETAKLVRRSSLSTTDWLLQIYNELYNGRPVLYYAESSVDNHVFVCDGYDGSGLFHINWGEGGALNGYYILTTLENNVEEMSYSSNHMAIIGISPSDGPHAALTDLLTLYNISTADSVYTRTSDNANFGPIHINSILQNNTDSNKMFEYAWALYDGIELRQIFDTHTTGTISADWWEIHDDDVSFGANLPNGSYQVRLMCRAPGSTDWYLANLTMLNYVQATLKDNTLTVSANTQGSGGSLNLSVTDFTAPETAKADSEINLHIELSNNSVDLITYLYVFVGNERMATLPVDLAAGKSSSFNVPLLVTSLGDNTIKLSTNILGTYELASRIINVTSSAAELSAKFTMKDVADEQRHELTENTFRFSVKMKNLLDQEYNDVLVARLFRTEQATEQPIWGTLVSEKSKQLEVPANGSKSLSFKFTDLDIDAHYFAEVLYMAHGQLVSAGFTPFTYHTPGTVTDINSDGIVDVSDMSIIINIILGTTSVTDYPILAGKTIDVQYLNTLINNMLEK